MDSAIDRRTALKVGGATVCCTCAAPVLGGCAAITGVSNTPEAPPASFKEASGMLVLTLASVPSLANVGGSAKLALERAGAEPDKVLVIRDGESSYRAYRDRCTHGGRELSYEHQKGMLQCVSFGHSKFGLDGSLKEGPAEKPLTVLESRLADGRLQLKLG